MYEKYNKKLTTPALQTLTRLRQVPVILITRTALVVDPTQD
jgi:hypothetical protein